MWGNFNTNLQTSGAYERGQAARPRNDGRRERGLQISIKITPVFLLFIFDVAELCYNRIKHEWEQKGKQPLGKA